MARSDLPDGYEARTASIEDAGIAADLLRLTGIAEGNRPGWTEQDLGNWWGNEYFEVADDVLLVTTPGSDQLVGIEVVAHGPPHVNAICFGGVHPDHYGRGLGTAMVRWAIERARERVALAPPGALVDIHCYVFADHEPSVALLERLGLTHDRYFVDMEIEFDGPPEPSPLPDGVVLRPFEPGNDDRAAWQSMDAAFEDHYGYVAISEEEGLARFRQRQQHPEFDPTLWWIAEADGEAIGGIWSEPSYEGDPDIGYVATLGVIREWRGRGLGKALLLHSFRQLYDRGKRGATLGVDAGSLTGATRLYESAGMHVGARYASYMTVLRDGEDMRTTSLDGSEERADGV